MLACHFSGAGSSAVEYMHSPLGLFPSPLARSAKISSVNRTKSKFRFLGKFMAKALLDNRLVSVLPGCVVEMDAGVCLNVSPICDVMVTDRCDLFG